MLGSANGHFLVQGLAFVRTSCKDPPDRRKVVEKYEMVVALKGGEAGDRQ